VPTRMAGLLLGLDWRRFILSSNCFVVAIIFCGCATGSSGSSGSPFEQLAGFSVTPNTAVLETRQSLQFITTGSSGSLVELTWKVNGVAGGSETLGTITPSGVYTAPSSILTGTVSVTATNKVSNATTSPAQVSFISPKSFASGMVSSSNHPQVALYNIVAPLGATVQVQFGTTTNYGLTTSAQPAPATGGSTGVLVAGMRANTKYHMQARLQLASGQQVIDADHTFTTGDLPVEMLPVITVPRAAGASAAPGIELVDIFDLSNATKLLALATDLAGNVIWYYPLNPGEVPYPIKPLPNGHMLVVVAGTSTGEIREIDLAGNVLYRLSIADVNKGLTAIGASFQAENFHHDIAKLPNGHIVILVNYTRTFSDQPGFSAVIGDALVDWDPQAQMPVWTWSTFDHIPLTHDPVSNTDWSHANAIIYSPDDGNLILSMRNQNWVIKINYQDGAGDGSILWHLGPDGDFTLPSGLAPARWNYGQHYPTILSPNSTGIFQTMIFNNGNNRLLDASNDVCGTPGFSLCYSSVPIFELNESAKTAQVLWETNLSPHFSICCGNASVLSNGDVEYDVAFDVNTPNQSYIQEVTREQTPQLLWQMNVAAQVVYRGFRIPSLYPDVEWTQTAIARASATAEKPPESLAVEH
jgi:arylsulfate sulfotransferase